MQPRHAVETDRKTVIISHWGRRKDAKAFQISEFDASGNAIKIFSGPDDLNDFPYMCLDSTGRVLIVDSWNCRVLLLNKPRSPKVIQNILGHSRSNIMGVKSAVRTAASSSSTRTSSWNAPWWITSTTTRTVCTTWSRVVSTWSNLIYVEQRGIHMEQSFVYVEQSDVCMEQCLDYVEQSGLLFVGESGEYVKVYNVSYPPSTANHIQPALGQRTA